MTKQQQRPCRLLVLLLATTSTITVLLPTHNVNVFGQEKPFVTIPRFQYNYIPPNFNTSIFRTDVCSRQHDIDNGKLDLRSALSGLNLSVAIINYKVPTENQLFSLSSDGGINETDPGLFAVILDELAKRAGFEWRNTYSVFDPIELTVDGNRTWSDLLLWELEHFDIAADYWGRSPERMARGVSFPKGWFDGDVVLVQSVKNNEDSVSLWSFLLPFNWHVWMAIVGVIIFTGLMYLLLERLDTESDERDLESKPWVSIFIASLTFTGHFEYRPNTNPARLLSFSLTFWSLIIAAAYTANLANFLIRRRINANIIVGTLEDALKHNTPVCVQRATIMDEFVTKRYPDMIVVRKDTERELFDALKLPWFNSNGGCGAVMTFRGVFDIYRRNIEVNGDCSLTTENQVVLRVPTGFATSFDTGRFCTSLISYVMNLHITEMINDGFLAISFQNYVNEISTVNCSSSLDATQDYNSDSSSLSVKDLSGIFIVHACTMIVAVVYAATQRWGKKKTE